MGWKSKISKRVGQFAWQTNNPWEGLQYAQKRAAPQMGGMFQDNPISNIGWTWGELTGKNKALDQNQQNLQYQREKYEYDKNLQREIFQREDNAVFRRQQDLLRSGLSPTLAAGSAAQTGPIVQTTAPRGEPMEGPNIMEAVKLAASLYTMKADVARTFSSIALQDAQRINVNTDTTLKETKADGAFFDNVIKKIDAINAGTSGLGKETSTFGKIVKDFEAWLRNFQGDKSPITTGAKASFMPKPDKYPPPKRRKTNKLPDSEYKDMTGW